MMRTIKKISWCLLIPFAVQQIAICGDGYGAVLPSFSPAPAEAARHSFPALDLPSEAGTVNTVQLGPGPVIFHIQEAHGDPESQKNIRAILHYLKSRYGVRRVFVEGSAFRLEPQLLRFYPKDNALTLRIAESLMEAGLLTGPELFLIEEPQAEGLGIEDAELYVSNAKAFKDVLLQQARTQEFIDQMNLQIERLSSPYLNKDLRSFLSRLDDFESGIIPFDKWLSELKTWEQKKSEVDLANPFYQLEWPMLSRIFSLKQFEQRIDFTIFEEERKAFLEAGGKFWSAGLQEEIKRYLSLNLSSHHLPDPQTSLFFKNMTARLPKDFNYGLYPNVNLFIGHLILQSELKTGLLMEEIRRLESEIALSLTQTEREKEVITLLKSHRLLKRLFELKLSPEDYEQVLARQDALKPSRLAEEFLRLNNENRVRNLAFEEMEAIDELFQLAVSFYRYARQRDEVMLENMEEYLRVSETGGAAVITGGFHAEPFKTYWMERDYTYVRISPAMTAVEGRKEYVRSIMTNYTFPEIKEAALKEAPYGATFAGDLRRLGVDPRLPGSGIARRIYEERSRAGLAPSAILEEFSGMGFIRQFPDPQAMLLGAVPSLRSELRSRPAKPIPPYPGDAPIEALLREHDARLEPIMIRFAANRPTVINWIREHGFEDLVKELRKYTNTYYPGDIRFEASLRRHKAKPEPMAEEFEVSSSAISSWIKRFGFEALAEQLRKEQPKKPKRRSKAGPYPGDGPFETLLRKHAAMQKLMAEELGVSPSTISKWIVHHGFVGLAKQLKAKPSKARSFPGRPSSYPGNERFIALLQEHQGEKQPIAEALGVSRRTISIWIEKFGFGDYAAHLKEAPLKEESRSAAEKPLLYPGDEAFEALLRRHQAKQVLIAGELGVGQSTISYWIRKYGFEELVKQLREGRETGDRGPRVFYPGNKSFEALLRKHEARQVPMAEELGATQSAISDWIKEYGFEDLAKRLKESRSELRGGDPESESLPDPPAQHLSLEDLPQGGSAMSELPQEIRDEVTALVKEHGRKMLMLGSEDRIMQPFAALPSYLGGLHRNLNSADKAGPEARNKFLDKFEQTVLQDIKASLMTVEKYLNLFAQGSLYLEGSEYGREGLPYLLTTKKVTGVNFEDGTVQVSKDPEYKGILIEKALAGALRRETQFDALIRKLRQRFQILRRHAAPLLGESWRDELGNLSSIEDSVLAEMSAMKAEIHHWGQGRPELRAAPENAILSPEWETMIEYHTGLLVPLQVKGEYGEAVYAAAVHRLTLHLRPAPAEAALELSSALQAFVAEKTPAFHRLLETPFPAGRVFDDPLHEEFSGQAGLKPAELIPMFILLARRPGLEYTIVLPSEQASGFKKSLREFAQAHAGEFGFDLLELKNFHIKETRSLQSFSAEVKQSLTEGQDPTAVVTGREKVIRHFGVMANLARVLVREMKSHGDMILLVAAKIDELTKNSLAQYDDEKLRSLDYAAALLQELKALRAFFTAA